MPKTKQVTYQDDDLTVKITVVRADIRAGMHRTRLQVEADASKDEDTDVHLLRRFTFPDLMAATTKATGMPWPLSFEGYLELPERLGVIWEAAAYELNPHWVPGWEERAASEKKQTRTKSTDGLSDGIDGAKTAKEPCPM